MDVAALLVELHRHRVDEEGHVVGDDLDDGVALGRPAVLGDGRGEDPHVGGALGPLVGQAELADRRAVHVDVGALGEVLDRDVAVVLPEELLGRLPRRSAAASPGGRQSCGLGEDVVLGLVHGGHGGSPDGQRHDVVPSPRP